MNEQETRLKFRIAIEKVAKRIDDIPLRGPQPDYNLMSNKELHRYGNVEDLNLHEYILWLVAWVDRMSVMSNDEYEQFKDDHL